jgi:hypothetical protein
MEGTETLPRNAAGGAPTPVLTDPAGSAATATKNVPSAALEGGHKIGCKRKGRVDFALFNIPASLNP